MNSDTPALPDLLQLKQDIRNWGYELGFQQVGIADTDLTRAERHLDEWLARGYHGDMHYMHRHGNKRSRPAELVDGTLSVISARMDYLPQVASDAIDNLRQKQLAYVSRYALGRDYHKLMRNRLQQLARRLTEAVGDYQFRVFTDSAPVLEKPLAEKAGLGWIGKHSNLLDRRVGSWFFLGEIYTDLPLPPDQPVSAHCGSCQACIDVCPTQAIVAPYQVDARLCISYLTIEHRGIIDETLRPLIGNRVYGCDDCQLCCPWNRFARISQEADYQPRHGLQEATLLELFGWSEEEFLQRLEGSPIRRIGYPCWQRNLAVALGNAPYSDEIIAALRSRLPDAPDLVAVHIRWALEQQYQRAPRKPD